MNRVESIVVAPTAGRQSSPGRFEEALQGASQALGTTVVGAVELAAPAVPMGTVLAGAVRGAVGGPRASVTPPAATGTGLTGTAGAGGDTGSTVVGGGSASDADLLAATRALQEQAQAWNLQYLQLQERMQQESREFTALSNVMKVKHDSARAAIGNIH